jgi:hypothetical protein
MDRSTGRSYEKSFAQTTAADNEHTAVVLTIRPLGYTASRRWTAVRLAFATSQKRDIRCKELWTKRA